MPQETRLSRVLLKEEYRAEKTIAIIRLVLYFVLTVQSIIKYLLLDVNMAFNWIPFAAALFFSAGVYAEILYYVQDRWKKYYTRFTKYLYIAGDAALIAFITFEFTKSTEYIELTDLSLEHVVPLGLISFEAIFMVMGIIRFSALSCLFTGFCFLVAYFVLSTQMPYYRSLELLFHEDGKYKMMSTVFVNFILMQSGFCAFIAYRLKGILVRSKKQEELERFLPEMLAQDVLNGDHEISMGGKKQRVTILFSDIRNFTSMSEKESPEDVVDLLNSYFNDMIEIIFHYNGTLDKIMGDGIMAIYGAPVFDDKAAPSAVRTAIDMHRKLDDFNEIRKLQNKDPIHIGVGIHTGDVILGNMGSMKRIEFTAIGDTVNTASRLEAFTKKVSAKIVISGETRQLLNGDFTIGELGKVALKGKAEKLEVFEVKV